MILESKNILVFAATGAIGSGAARKFAQEGATVWISGRNQTVLDEVASSIQQQGGKVQCHVVDATDPDAVQAYVSQVADASGQIDGVFNAIGARPVDLGYPQPAGQMSLNDFMLPFQVVVASTFLTSRTVGSVMAQQGTGGTIVTLSATLSSMTAPFMTNISAACGAIEAMTRSFAGEFGMAGIRVNCVRGSGMPETRTIQETGAGYQALGVNVPMSLPPLGRPITVADTAAAAAFLASDLSSGMTGQVVTVCAGAFVD